ncbi:L-fuconolactonase [Salegentibacter holothuriorum]|uniref:L-fuconolactonase n=1 Tax=Salegentibacter holothuriorum TaxID=241145 RepID=A0A1T5DI71_9FLAO|nr:amidohydrolase family protein [Salegentibacter holothuriorum]SKB71337.1 L-fuconolactonase [Salegentibacter holothuriorum]
MRIDSHQHFWKFEKEKDAWIPDEMSVIRKDFFPENLKPVLERNKVDGCVAVQAAPTENETKFLLNLAKEYEFIKGVVGWVDFTGDNVEERLAYFSKDPKFKGVRHLLQAESANYMLQPEFLKGMEAFGNFNLTYDLLVLEDQLANTIELVSNFPNQKFVLNHLAKPNVSKGISKNWKELITKLADKKNVSCKLSGLLTETENFSWKPEDFYPFFDFALEVFGPNRLMFGSDWPVSLAAGQYADTLGIIENFLMTKNEIVIEKIMGLNAINFYQL